MREVLSKRESSVEASDSRVRVSLKVSTCHVTLHTHRYEINDEFSRVGLSGTGITLRSVRIRVRVRVTCIL